MTHSRVYLFRHFYLVLCLGILCISNPVYGVQEKELDIRREVRAIQKEFRVRVHYLYDEDMYFPPGSTLERFNSSATELSETDIRRVLPVVRVFLSSYPDRILRRHLGDIYLMQELTMAGGGWGGTYYKSGIYINCKAGERKILSTMYHETSSMLMKNYRFPTRAWQNINGSEARYIGAQHFADGRNRGGASSKQGFEMGFLTNYARSSLENDFNVMSEWLFTRFYRLRRLAKEYPKIGEKMELAIDFYKDVDDDFEFTDKAKL